MSTALLVVDVQMSYVNPDSELHCEDADATVQRINRLIERFEESGRPIVLIRHMHKADGSDAGRMFDFAGDDAEELGFVEGTDEVKYPESLVRPPNCIEMTKNRYSAFAGTGLDETLRQLGVSRVVICGFMANFCCESTARDAHDRDYFVDFILDATGTPGTESMDESEVRKVVGQLLEEGFAAVMSTEECLAIDYSSS